MGLQLVLVKVLYIYVRLKIEFDAFIYSSPRKRLLYTRISRSYSIWIAIAKCADMKLKPHQHSLAGLRSCPFHFAILVLHPTFTASLSLSL